MNFRHSVPWTGRRHRCTRLAPALVLVMSVFPGLILTTAASGQSTAALAQVPVSSLPKAVQPYYEDLQAWGRLYSDPFMSYKVPPPPWKFCESTNYLANGWEIGNRNELEGLVSQYQAAGLAKGGLITVNSNLSIPLQITQLDTLIAEGCNVIFAIPGSPTAMCPTFANALAKNILVVTDDTDIYCPSVINSSWPNYYSPKLLAAGLAKALGGKGNVVELTGIPGALGTKITLGGFTTGLQPYPGIKVTGQVEGDWTESVAQTALIKFLATHPEPVNGILDGADMATGGVLAMQESGRPLPKMTLYEDECSAMALWKEHPGLFVATQDQGPIMAAYESMLVAARLLAGQQPTVNTIVYPIPGPTQQTFSQWYKPSMTVESTCFATPPPSALIPDSYYNQFFTGGHTPRVTLKLVSV